MSRCVRLHCEWYGMISFPTGCTANKVSDHKQVDVKPILPPSSPNTGVMPGDMVGHDHDVGAFGIVVAAAGDSCCVLWSVPPRHVVPEIDIAVREIKSATRRLKARWDLNAWEDKKFFDMTVEGA